MSEDNECSEEHDMTPGKFSWNELMSSDKAGSKAFYAGLFGWTTEDMDAGNGKTYSFFKKDGESAAGLIQISDEMGPVPPHWLSYVTVDDVAASAAKVTELGGTIVVPVTELPMGSLAILKDPQGATLGLWQFAQQA